MERIKIQTSNALDRMEIMQKRYHEYQEAIKAAGGSSQDVSRPPINVLPSHVCRILPFFPTSICD